MRRILGARIAAKSPDAARRTFFIVFRSKGRARDIRSIFWDIMTETWDIHVEVPLAGAY